MPTLRTILDDTTRREFDAPPIFDSVQRRAFFNLPAWAWRICKSLNEPHNQVMFGLQVGYFRATKNGITFANGRTEQSNFLDNPVLRINEVPKIEVHILADGGAKMKGVGEPGLPPLAPALANAIFAATGIRVRKMPFDLDNLS